MRDDLYVSLKNLGRKELNDKEIVILLSLNGLIVGDLTQNCINYTVLGYAIFGRKVNQSEKETIKKHFNKLIEKNFIQKNKLFDNSTYLCNVEQIFVNVQQNNLDSEYYVHITKNELHKMMNASDAIDNYKLVRLYLWYINSLHKGDQVKEKYRGKIGFMPQSYLSKMAGINIKTLYKYNEILQEIKLLYIVHHKIEFNDETGVSGITNTYSRYKDKALCYDYATNVKTKSYEEENLDVKLFKQTYSQKFHQFSLGKSYPLAELYKINQYVEIYNSEIDKNLRKGSKLDNSRLIKEIKKMSGKTSNNTRKINPFLSQFLEEKREKHHHLMKVKTNYHFKMSYQY